MNSVRVPLLELQQRFDRSEAALRVWRRKGCPGFCTIAGRVYGDPRRIQAWLDKTKQAKPGPKARYRTPMEVAA